MECLYQVVEVSFSPLDPTQSEFGIAATVMYDECTVVLAAVYHISCNRMAVTALAALCNRLKLDPIHLPDVVYDFLAQM